MQERLTMTTPQPPGCDDENPMRYRVVRRTKDAEELISHLCDGKREVLLIAVDLSVQHKWLERGGHCIIVDTGPRGVQLTEWETKTQSNRTRKERFELVVERKTKWG
jgi:hypothetical protein